ncbi:MAG: hypothetical protein H0T42_05340 [Deltaproteobacteria bacterium]|nr:hypothetical protein [Deltaproteobacteria bacterium]
MRYARSITLVAAVGVALALVVVLRAQREPHAVLAIRSELTPDLATARYRFSPVPGDADVSGMIAQLEERVNSSLEKMPTRNGAGLVLAKIATRSTGFARRSCSPRRAPRPHRNHRALPGS